MGRTKRSGRQAPPTHLKQDKSDAAKAKTTEDSNTEEFNSSVHSVDLQNCPDNVLEEGLLAGEMVVGDKSSARQKRKCSQMQTSEADSCKSKRRRTASLTTSKVTTLRTPSNKTLQNSKQAGRYPMRCRMKNGSQHLQSTASFPAGLKDVTERESDIKSKSRKRSTKNSVTVYSTRTPSSVAGAISDGDELLKKKSKSKTDGAVKKETKPEVGGALESQAEGVPMKPEINAEVGSRLSTSKEARKLVGAHCSIAGGLHKAVEEAVAMGGRAFGLFLKSQRCWASKPLDPDAAEKFKASCKEHGFPPNSILPHGSYLMNCGSPNQDTLKKSRESLLDELQRCEALGLTLFNFHPGSTCGEISIEKCLDNIAEAINWAHKQTKFVITVIENMSCQGNTIGGRFEELKGIIDRVKDKSRIGVCLDTCHAFAAGYDLSSKQGFEKFVSDFDRFVGFQYLKAMHLNDSKGAVGCHLDRHENIGKGKIGMDGFRRVMAEPRFDGIPMILETPLGDYAKEIKLLNKMMK